VGSASKRMLNPPFLEGEGHSDSRVVALVADALRREDVELSLASPTSGSLLMDGPATTTEPEPGHCIARGREDSALMSERRVLPGALRSP